MGLRGYGARAVMVTSVLAGVLVSGYVSTQAIGSEPTRCERHATGSAARASVVTGSGERVVVLGDSWSAGLGLRRPASSWPAHLDGRVQVAGFSGSGFSAGASPCGRDVSFPARAVPAVLGGADLVVVQGGLNDFDQPPRTVRAGFTRLMRSLASYDVVVVGPALAPSRAARVPAVDRLLAELAREHGVEYVRTTDLELSYLRDGLHLTRQGHRRFGEAVAQRISALG